MSEGAGSSGIADDRIEGVAAPRIAEDREKGCLRGPNTACGRLAPPINRSKGPRRLLIRRQNRRNGVSIFINRHLDGDDVSCRFSFVQYLLYIRVAPHYDVEAHLAEEEAEALHQLDMYHSPLLDAVGTAA